MDKLISKYKEGVLKEFERAEKLNALYNGAMKANRQLRDVNEELSGCLGYHIKENKELKEELIQAYRSRGGMYWAGEKDWIENRLKELKDELDD